MVATVFTLSTLLFIIFLCKDLPKSEAIGAGWIFNSKHKKAATGSLSNQGNRNPKIERDRPKSTARALNAPAPPPIDATDYKTWPGNYLFVIFYYLWCFLFISTDLSFEVRTYFYHFSPLRFASYIELLREKR